MDRDADVEVREYLPDRWVVLKISPAVDAIGEPVFKVFAGWGGGYLSGDSWKLNSGVVEVHEDDKHWFFVGHSGSVYRCRKSGYGLTGYMSAVLSSWEAASGQAFEILPEDYDFMWLSEP